MTADKYFDLKKKIIERGYAHDIDWIANIQPCRSYAEFVDQTIWVILNSGMREQVARKIWARIQEVLKKQAYSPKKDISKAFKHKGKVAAIEYVIENKEKIWFDYLQAEDKIAFLTTIPFIGPITKFHLAKNLGFDCIKPDRHLVRIAKTFSLTPEAMCELIRERTGEKLSMIDMVIWRAANLGFV